jgi:DNA-binding CsgD family transcriptional regulator
VTAIKGQISGEIDEAALDEAGRGLAPSAERLKEIEYMVTQENKTCQEIGAHFGCNRSNINAIMIRHFGKDRTTAMLNDARENRKNAKTHPCEVCSKPTRNRRFCSERCMGDGTTDWGKHQELARLRAAGKTTDEIAAEVGLKPHSVRVKRLRTASQAAKHGRDLTETVQVNENFDDEIRQSRGSYNFPWTVDNRHGTANVRYDVTKPDLDIRLISVRDSDGEEIEDPSLVEKIREQAVAYIGRE